MTWKVLEQIAGAVENYKLMQSVYDSSWRKMWLSRPKVRMDGIYVSRNTYIRAGVAEWKVTEWICQKHGLNTYIVVDRRKNHHLLKLQKISKITVGQVNGLMSQVTKDTLFNSV